MRKELFIFGVLFLVLALGMHSDFFTHPLDRMSKLFQADAYGLGAVHPLVFGFLAYVALGILRGLYYGAKNIFGR